jgi:hypothetical protein
MFVPSAEKPSPSFVTFTIPLTQKSSPSAASCCSLEIQPQYGLHPASVLLVMQGHAHAL